MQNTNGAVYLLTAEQLGISDPEPGKNLMNNYIHALEQHTEAPKAILLINTAVRLAAGDSKVLEALKGLSERSCDILLCGMCVNYYGLADKIAVGRISNMLEISGILSSASHAVTL